MATRPDLIRDYFRRQYETEEGSTEENVTALFAHDLIYRLSGERAMGREDLIALTDLLRRTRRDRQTQVSDFTEEGDLVSFVMSIVASDTDSSDQVTVNTRTTYRFRGDKVIDVWQEDPAGLEDAVRAAGVQFN